MMNPLIQIGILRIGLGWLLAPVLALVLVSCAAGPSVPTIYVLNGVKLLAPNLSESDSSTLRQESYELGVSRRLLVRFEELPSYVDRIDTTSSKKVQIKISVLEASNQASAIGSLRLCPVTRNWMMFATWDFAHPFLGGEPWTAPGGDYTESQRVKGTADGSTDILFDVTSWFIEFPKARKQNYGHLLIASADAVIVGDASNASTTPRMLFDLRNSIFESP